MNIKGYTIDTLLDKVRHIYERFENTPLTPEYIAHMNSVLLFLQTCDEYDTEPLPVPTGQPQGVRVHANGGSFDVCFVDAEPHALNVSPVTGGCLKRIELEPHMLKNPMATPMPILLGHLDMEGEYGGLDFRPRF